MLYSAFQAQVRRQLEESSENVWADASLLYWTNEAVRELARKAKPMRDEQYATVIVGQSSYTLPDYTTSLIACQYDDGSIRWPLMREEVDELVARDLSGRGTPIAYAVDDENIYLRPTPDAAGTIRFWRYHRPDAITADTDTLPYGDDYATAIELYVLARAFEQISDWESATQYRNRYDQAIHDVTVQEMAESDAGLSSAPVEVF